MKIKCPICKYKLEELWKENESSIHKKTYICSNCDKLFERHRILNELGLVKSENLYEINEDGDYLNSW